MTKIAKEHDLARVCRRAQAEIQDAQIRKALVELVAMFALGLVTAGVATAVGGLARGMMLARTVRGVYMVGEAVEVIGGGGYVMAQMAGGFAALGTDVVLTSLGQSGLTGQPLLESLKQNLIGSSVMALAMKPFGLIVEDLGKVRGKLAEDGTVLAVKITADKTILAARGAILSMEVIGVGAANFAATNLQVKGTATEPELFEWLTQGGMMVVGKVVGAGLKATHARLDKLGEAVRNLAKRRATLTEVMPGTVASMDDFLSAERILDPAFMQEAARKLGIADRSLLVGVPKRAHLFATSFEHASADPDHLQAFCGVLAKLFAEAGPDALTPWPIMVAEGRIVSIMEVG